VNVSVVCVAKNCKFIAVELSFFTSIFILWGILLLEDHGRGLSRKTSNLDSTQLNLDLSNAHIKSIIYLFQETEHALKDSSVTKSYQHYNSS
jgi:hypothetical protein